MKLLVIMAVALRALGRNKTRSLLTALGIIIGIAAVIAVMALGGGARMMVQAQIDSMGSNMIWVFNGSSHGGGFRGGSGSQMALTVEDGEAIARECGHVTGMTPQINTGANLIYRQNNWRPSVRGVGIEYPDVRTLTIERGAFFTEADIRGAARVVFLGQTVVDRLFDGEEPVGKTIRINSMAFRVVGVFARKGATAWGMDQDDLALMPWTTANQTIERSRLNKVSQLSMSVDSRENIEQTKEEIAALLRQRHRIPPGGADDFNITDPAEMSSSSTELTKIMSMLLTIIASISLFVGGIGIMNIMLVSVTERTREIGLRLAVGARGGDILLQFLIEAIALSGVGGLIGVGLGVATAQTLASTNGWPVAISGTSIALGLGVACGIGILFGFFPALRAARLNPIESLRYE